MICALVITGLDPAIHQGRRSLLKMVRGSSPRITAEKESFDESDPDGTLSDYMISEAYGSAQAAE
jgi:hypothetical protein